MTITVNLIRRFCDRYISLGTVLDVDYFFADEGFDMTGATPYAGGGIYDVIDPISNPIDNVTFFASRNDAEVYSNNQAWTTTLANLNGNTFDPNAGNYVQGVFLEVPFYIQNLLDLKQEKLDKTIISAGTTGPQTINKNAGSVNFAANDTSLVVTNSLVNANSVIIATVATNDTNMQSVQAVASSGSFTLYPDTIPAAETRVNFIVIN